MKLFSILFICVSLFLLASCDSPANLVSENLSEEVDQFKILRKIVFYNGITDTYMFAIEGYCSIMADVYDNQVEVTCKVGENTYEKHFLGLSDKVTYFLLQLETANVSEFLYKFYLRPETLIPEIEVQKDNQNGN